MRYFVIGPDGSKYGPADLTSLNAWAAESRVLPSTMLEEEGTGRQMPASDAIGIIFPMSPPSAPQQSSTPPTFAQQPVYTQQPTYPQDQPQAPYSRPVQQGGDGSTEVTWAWVLGALGLCCCFVFSVVGIVLAIKGKDKGHPNGMAAMIFNIVTLVLSIGGGVIYMAAGMGSRHSPWGM